MFEVLYKWLNCAVDKTIATGHTTNTNCNYRILLLVMLFITSWWKP